MNIFTKLVIEQLVSVNIKDISKRERYDKKDDHKNFICRMREKIYLYSVALFRFKSLLNEQKNTS